MAVKILYKQKGNMLMAIALMMCIGNILISYNSITFRSQIHSCGSHVFASYGTKIHTDTVLNITVVAAFFDVESFPKGSRVHVRNASAYYEWARVFKYLMNPMVIYTDSRDFQLHMMEVREDLMPTTKNILIDRNSSWAFRNIDKIRKVFSERDYPKFYPNTVVPEFTCATHAKFDVLSRAAGDNPFKSIYFTWLDIGYFKHRIGSTELFYLTKPNQFNKGKIAMNRLFSHHFLHLSPKEIFLNNRNYVGTGVMLGEREQIIKFSSDVKRAIDYFLSQGLINTEQQVIYAMYSPEGKRALQPGVSIQYYVAPNFYSRFYLGNTMSRVLT